MRWTCVILCARPTGSFPKWPRSTTFIALPGAQKEEQRSERPNRSGARPSHYAWINLGRRRSSACGWA